MLPSSRLQIEKAIRYIDENFKSHPSIDEITKKINMSKFHFIRTFKGYVGLTPKQFLHCVTLNYAKEQIKESKSILDCSLDIGLSSSSRLHELFVNLIGVSPKEWRERGKNVSIVYGYGDTPFGDALIGFTSKGICYLGFVSRNREEICVRFYELFKNANLQCDNELAETYLKDIFRQSSKMGVQAQGTNLQVNVWKALLNLQNRAELESKKIVFFPCYRVVANSGAISGYRWSIEQQG